MKLIKADDVTDARDKNAPPDALSQLTREAEQLENATDLGTDEAVNGPAPGGPDAPPTANNATIIAGAVSAGREAFCFFTKLQSLRVTLNDEIATGLGEAVGPALSKHGIELKALIGDFGAELTAAAALYAVVTGVIDGHRAEVAAIKASRAEAEAASAAS